MPSLLDAGDILYGPLPSTVRCNVTPALWHRLSAHRAVRRYRAAITGVLWGREYPVSYRRGSLDVEATYIFRILMEMTDGQVLPLDGWAYEDGTMRVMDQGPSPCRSWDLYPGDWIDRLDEGYHLIYRPDRGSYGGPGLVAVDDELKGHAIQDSHWHRQWAATGPVTRSRLETAQLRWDGLVEILTAPPW